MFDWLWNKLVLYYESKSTLDLVWEGIGVFAQVLFASRWAVQWFFSEKAKRSIVPIEFWYISIAGGVILLAYGFYIVSIPVILGQAGGLAVYIRNLFLIYKRRREEAAAKVPVEDQAHQHD